MASTYSPYLKLELITTGEQQGTWGTTTNNNLGTLLEQAIAGWEAVPVTDSAVDTTLTLTDGVASNARNMTLSLTGALTATRNVVCPAIEKMYIVRNGTTGGFPVTFKTATQPGVSIPFGQTMIIYVDGTDARQASIPVSNTNVAQISSIELGAASDTTITRSSAGVIAVEGVTVPLNSITSIHTAQQIELGAAADTTITRSSAGVIAVEGGIVPLQNRVNTFTAQQIISSGGMVINGGGMNVTAGGIIGNVISTANTMEISSVGGRFKYANSTAVTQTGGKGALVITGSYTSGKITMDAASLAAGATVVFPMTCGVTANDVLVVSVDKNSIATAGTYRVLVDSVAAGSANISVTNISAGALAEAVVINFAVLGTQ